MARGDRAAARAARRHPLGGGALSGVLLDELDLLFPHTLLVTFTPGERDAADLLPRPRDQVQPPHADRPRGRAEPGHAHLRGDDAHLAIPGQPAPLRRGRPARGVRDAARGRPVAGAAVAARLRADPVPHPRHGAGGDEAGAQARRPSARPPRKCSSTSSCCARGRTTSPRPRCAATIRCAARAWACAASRRRWWPDASPGAHRTCGTCSTTSEEDQRVAQQISPLNQEYDKITRALPSFGVGGSTMRDAVNFYNSSIRDFPRLADFTAAFSQVLDRHPEMRLTQLAWTATDDPEVGAAARAQHAGAQPAREVGRRRRGAARAQAGRARRSDRSPAAATKWCSSKARCGWRTTISAARWTPWSGSRPT